MWTDADSTVLIHVMSKLNKRYDYGLDMFLLSVDEGITGYRDDSLEVSEASCSRLREAGLAFWCDCAAEVVSRPARPARRR